jgi:hypothetical protein
MICLFEYLHALIIYTVRSAETIDLCRVARALPTANAWHTFLLVFEDDISASFSLTCIAIFWYLLLFLLAHRLFLLHSVGVDI